jgi:hypothetical protein
MWRGAVALCVLIAGVATYDDVARADWLSNFQRDEGLNHLIKPDGFPADKIDANSSSSTTPTAPSGVRPVPGPVFTGPQIPQNARILVHVGQSELGKIDEMVNSEEAPGKIDEIGAAPVFGAIKMISYRPDVELADLKATPMPAAAFAVGIAYDGNHWCTGVLLDPRHVLTAGHCACGEPSTYRIVTDPEIAAAPRDGEYRLKGRPILYDRRSCPRSDEAVPGGDFALLPLDRDVKCTEGKTCRIGFPETVDAIKDKAPDGSKLFVVGYGWTDKDVSRLRNSGHVPIVSRYCVESNYRGFCNPFTEMVLADLGKRPDQRTDTCGGDSGGPVFLEVGDWAVLVAITSRATPWSGQGKRGCGAGGVYELVGRKSVWAWLQANGVAIAGAAGAEQQAVSGDKVDTKTVAARAGAPSRARATETGNFNCADHVVAERGADPDQYCYRARGR